MSLLFLGTEGLKTLASRNAYFITGTFLSGASYYVSTKKVSPIVTAVVYTSSLLYTSKAMSIAIKAVIANPFKGYF
jgi:hypothetical protein